MYDQNIFYCLSWSLFKSSFLFVVKKHLNADGCNVSPNETGMVVILYCRVVFAAEMLLPKGDNQLTSNNCIGFLGSLNAAHRN